MSPPESILGLGQRVKGSCFLVFAQTSSARPPSPKGSAFLTAALTPNIASEQKPGVGFSRRNDLHPSCCSPVD